MRNAESHVLGSTVRMAVALVVSSLVLYGCAFGNRTVSMNYEAGKPKEVAPATKDLVGVTKFQDARADKKTIGEVRNGMMMKTADVLSADEELGGWVTNAILGELAARGYTGQAVDAGGDAGYLISGTLNEVFSKMGAGGMHSKVRMNIVVNRKGVVVLNKEYEGKENTFMSSVSAEAYTKAFEKALRKALDVFFVDLAAELGKLGK